MSGSLLKTIALAALMVIATALPARAAARFPNTSSDWRIELVAESPAIQHPSVVCTAPDGRVFVAEDPMDISAPANATRGRILCFHRDGRRTIFATNLYAVFGMQYLEGKLYVLHNPRFSVFMDDNGTGRDRSELIESTHPNPWALDWNDHVPANFRLAMDGYFYLAVGDKGIYGAVGRDGKRLDLQGGGIVRLRPDGTGLEIYCTGVRNILDVALNAADEIFTYDNTDEHDWMGRLTHMVDGGFYGYPHDFVPRRPYTLWMMADFGAGAATGAFAYTEDALPAEYHDNLFLGDFGKRQVLRVRIERDGGTYRVLSKEELFPDPPEDFRPVGIAPSSDGLSIYICDWAHRDTKENVQVGRLWKLTYTGTNHAAPKPSWYVSAASGGPCSASRQELIEALSHGSKNVRLAAQRELERRLARSRDAETLGALRSVATNTNGVAHARWHALWILRFAGDNRTLVSATLDPNPTVRRQALRCLGTGSGPTAREPFRKHLVDPNASVRFAAAVALGRAGDATDVPFLAERLNESDSFTRYALFTGLNRIGKRDPKAWRQIVQGLDQRDTSVRDGTVLALRETYDMDLLKALEAKLRDSTSPQEIRAAALRLITETHHQPAVWKGEWGAYHPALQPAPPKATEWAGTQRVLAIIREMIGDRNAEIRQLAVKAVAASRDTNAIPILVARYKIESDLPVRRTIIASAGAFKNESARELALAVIHDTTEPGELIREAVLAIDAMGYREAAMTVADVLRRPTVDRDLVIAVLTALGNLKAANASRQVVDQMVSSDASIQIAAIRALGKIGGDVATSALRDAATTGGAETRTEAIKALGLLRDVDSVPVLIDAWRNSDTQQPALEALARLSDIRALDAYLSGLAAANPATRDLCRKALLPIREQVLPEIEKRIAHVNPTAIGELANVYTNNPAAAFLKSVSRTPAIEEYEKFALQHDGDPARGRDLFADQNGVACIKCHSVSGAAATLSISGSGVKTIGPDLTSIGTQFARPTLVEHILYPSKAVREGYAQTIVETSDAETISGLVQSETADQLNLVDASGVVHRLPKSKITQRTASSFSLMPEGLHTGLTLTQFADLIAYLESLKGQNLPPK